MRKIVLAAVAALASSAGPVLAADMIVKARPVVAPPPPAWDIAFGSAVMSDYNFRGISQSDRGPSVNAYFEPRYNINPNMQLYAGISGYSVKLATDPVAEIDLYAGFRPTFGPVTLDFGAMYYWYPRERAIDGVVIVAPPAFNTTLSNTDFWEIYAKGLWTVNPVLTLGTSLYYADSWLNTGASGTYLSGTGKLVAPSTAFPTDWGMYLSGELAYYWLGTTKFVPGVFVDIPGTGGWNLPDYAYWNIGLGITWKTFTLDLRYHDTDLSRAECNALTADPSAAFGVTAVNNFITTGLSKWCNATFIAKLSVDLTANTNLK